MTSAASKLAQAAGEESLTRAAAADLAADREIRAKMDQSSKGRPRKSGGPVSLKRFMDSQEATPILQRTGWTGLVRVINLNPYLPIHSSPVRLICNGKEDAMIRLLIRRGANLPRH